MKSLNRIALLMTAIFSFAMMTGFAQIKNAKTETLNVYGNCGTCKKNIEKASYKKNISKGIWDIDRKTLLLTYDSVKTSSDAVLKNIALSGYDNDKYKAPDAAYAKLDGCCQYERKKEVAANTNPTITTNPIATTATIAISPAMKNVAAPDTIKPVVEVVKVNPLKDVYAAYFGIKDALAKDDGATASLKAKDLFKAIDAVQMDKLTAEQHSVWMKYQQQLSYHAEHIKGTTDAAHQREHFIILSADMYEVMKVIKMDVPVYYDFCPMANGGKGANWLSKQQPISNPYFGAQMPTCGRVQETIK